jgi:L-amino acid N-acyltransferase YncA
VVYRTRTATPADAASIARIYNQGIEDRLATFETRLREPGDVEGWVTAGLPVVVVEDEAGEVLAWASAGPYRLEREVYAGIGDFSVYVARERRGEGAGRTALRALIEETTARGYWKLVGRIFPENGPSLALARALGFREVGVYRRHARLDGEWRDCVVVERLL